MLVQLLDFFLKLIYFGFSFNALADFVLLLILHILELRVKIGILLVVIFHLTLKLLKLALTSL